ncbi:hypothetical protein ARMSODRAFT_972884 [Armillaria solidipes]|uniref:Uncharacterized protein n=1 Tax=Armillaria solidipes TaxID=1076256 RepID=A0A2H3CAB9_9AGAR|nr:hypothetical protein ARMSODRAFT_972884 [Armillaria solidipes]
MNITHDITTCTTLAIVATILAITGTIVSIIIYRVYWYEIRIFCSQLFRPTLPHRFPTQPTYLHPYPLHHYVPHSINESSLPSLDLPISTDGGREDKTDSPGNAQRHQELDIGQEGQAVLYSEFQEILVVSTAGLRPTNPDPDTVSNESGICVWDSQAWTEQELAETLLYIVLSDNEESYTPHSPTDSKMASPPDRQSTFLFPSAPGPPTTVMASNNPFQTLQPSPRVPSLKHEGNTPSISELQQRLEKLVPGRSMSGSSTPSTAMHLAHDWRNKSIEHAKLPEAMVESLFRPSWLTDSEETKEKWIQDKLASMYMSIWNMRQADLSTEVAWRLSPLGQQWRTADPVEQMDIINHSVTEQAMVIFNEKYPTYAYALSC